MSIIPLKTIKRAKLPAYFWVVLNKSYVHIPRTQEFFERFLLCR